VTSMHFIGLDIHKKTISYCVKDVSGQARPTLQTRFGDFPSIKGEISHSPALPLREHFEHGAEHSHTKTHLNAKKSSCRGSRRISSVRRALGQVRRRAQRNTVAKQRILTDFRERRWHIPHAVTRVRS
jgi:hypothetical protein